MSKLMPGFNEENNNQEAQLKSVYIIGGIAALLSLLALVLDIVIGSLTGGNLSELPRTAMERFAQFNQNAWLGLYNLDFSNTVNQLITVPYYFALYAAHRKTNQANALLALIIFLLGTAVFVANNTALPMLELSRTYANASDLQKPLLAAAGEAMLARGAHGSLGAFFGFLLPTIAGLVMSLVMLQGKVFSKVNAYFGIIGNLLMLAYVVLVTFAPAVKQAALAISMPGGLLLLAWMVMLSMRLFTLGGSADGA